MRARRWSWALLLAFSVLAASCRRQVAPRPAPPVKGKAGPVVVAMPPPPRPPMPWDQGGPLAAGETFALGAHPGRQTIEEARRAGLLDVDLSDGWAPYLFSDGDDPAEPKPNAYRSTFVALANNRVTSDELFLESDQGRRAVLAAARPARPRSPKDRESEEDRRKKVLEAARRALVGERSRNFLEVFGIPPTLSVLHARIQEDRGRACYQTIDREALGAFSGSVPYLNRDRARKEYTEALTDAAWAAKVLGAAPAGATLPTSILPPGSALPAPPPAGSPGPSLADRRVAARLERYRRGQARLRAVRAAQARLVCEGLLSPRSKFTDGMFDLPTHEALALWERKNDIFGWGLLGGETVEALLRPPPDLHLDTFKRLLAERVADAAGIIEDGSVGKGKHPATFRDGDERAPVPDLIGTHVEAVLAAMHIAGPEDLAAVLDELGPDGLANLHLAIAAPPLPPYYGPRMDLSVEIDRGDVWYDFPWDRKGKPIEQRREHFPQLTVFTTWQGQKVPLARWRTTIGSWRSELHADGKVYYKYKNSDVGPRIWKNIVAAPVWIPPEGTPARDLLTRKVFDVNVGPVPVVNTDVMGPGFQSAYGLAMAIHLKPQPGGGVFDNQIRTHGSDDYTSIARRFSHGCHRLVNNRAVRLFDFVLRRRSFARVGNIALVHFKNRLTVDDKEFEYELKTRGYYYELTPPVPVVVNEGRIMGKVAKPVTAFVRKPGVSYGPAPGDEDAGGAP